MSRHQQMETNKPSHTACRYPYTLLRFACMLMVECEHKSEVTMTIRKDRVACMYVAYADAVGMYAYDRIR
jgi:hypothetical protein